MTQNLELPQVTLGGIGITEFIGVLRIRCASLRMTLRTRSTASRIKSNGDGLRSGGELIPTLAATAAAKVGHPTALTMTVQKDQIHVLHTSQQRACMGHPPGCSHDDSSKRSNTCPPHKPTEGLYGPPATRPPAPARPPPADLSGSRCWSCLSTGQDSFAVHMGSFALDNNGKSTTIW